MSLERLCACLHSNRCNIYYRYNVSTGDIILCNNGGLGQRSVIFFFRVPLFSEDFINIDDHEYAN